MLLRGALLLAMTPIKFVINLPASIMLKQKIKEWLKRYWLAEIVCTTTAIVAASIAHYIYNEAVIAAFVGSLGEAIGFYSTVFIQNIQRENKIMKEENASFSFQKIIKVISSLILEFGPARLIDGLLLRPFFMYIFPILLHDFTLGILLGKFAGDITFYLLVIASYEVQKRFKKVNEKKFQ